MGKYIERADQTTRILDMGYGRLGFDDDDAIVSAQWHVLLRSVSAYHAFRTRHPGPISSGSGGRGQGGGAGRGAGRGSGRGRS